MEGQENGNEKVKLELKVYWYESPETFEGYGSLEQQESGKIKLSEYIICISSNPGIEARKL